MTAAARRHSSEATKPADEAIKSAASGSEAVFALVQLPIGYCRQRANWLRRRRRVRFVASSAAGHLQCHHNCRKILSRFPDCYARDRTLELDGIMNNSSHRS